MHNTSWAYVYWSSYVFNVCEGFVALRFKICQISNFIYAHLVGMRLTSSFSRPTDSSVLHSLHLLASADL